MNTESDFWRLLQVSNLIGLSSGRQFVHSVSVWHVYVSIPAVESYTIVSQCTAQIT